MLSSLLVSPSSSSANPAPRFYLHWFHRRLQTLTPLFRWRTQSVPFFSVSASPNVALDDQLHKLLEDIRQHSRVHIHGIQKNLQYWIANAEGSDTTYNGVQFKLHEAMPLIVRDVLEFQTELTTGAIRHGILPKINILLSIRYRLSEFISKVDEELMIINNRNSSTEDPLKQHIANVEGHISELKNKLHYIAGIANLDCFTIDTPKIGEIPEDALSRIYQNVDKMDTYLSSLVATYRRPSKMLQKWMLLTVGAIGVATLSMWIFNQSGPLGIMDNTVAAIKDFVIGHVKEPLTDIKDELFNKSMKSDMELMEVEEVRLNEEWLRRMLLDFIKPTTDDMSYNDMSYTNKSNEEIIERLVERYAGEIKSPIRGIIKGDLVQACLIQVHKLKLDVLKGKLSVNKIMRANGLTFAIVAASPTIGVFSLGLLIIYKQVNKLESKGRLARRRLLKHIEGRLIELQSKGYGHKEYCHGLLLYTLDQLYKATESPAKATHEWESVRDDITNLAEITNLGKKHEQVADWVSEANGILLRLKDYACLSK